LAKKSSNYKNLLVSLSDAYSNIKFNNSWEFVSYKIKRNSMITEFDYLDLIEEIKNINYNIIKEYLSNIVQKSSLTSLVYGNIESSNVNNLFDIFNGLYSNNINPLPKINELENFELVHPNIQEKSNCVCYFYPIGLFIPREYVLLGLTANILRQSFFDNLRTKNQLGYLVSMGSTSIRNYNFFIVQKIQSDKPIKFIEEKIEEYNKTIRKQIQEVDFEKFVETLKNELEEPEYSLEEKIDKYLNSLYRIIVTWSSTGQIIAKLYAQGGGSLVSAGILTVTDTTYTTDNNINSSTKKNNDKINIINNINPYRVTSHL
jgi:insulysin